MITIKDIAREVGMSQSTVSIVLRGEGDKRKISKATQDYIWDTARNMGYQVNVSARGLRTRDDSLLIAVYWTIDYRSSYMMDFFAGLLERAEGYQQKIEFVIKPYQDLEQTFEVGGAFQGAIVCNATEEQVQYLETLKCLFPIVIYNRDTDKLDRVYVDDYDTGKLAAEILMKVKAQKALFLTAGALYRGMSVLKDSFCQSMFGYNIPVQVIEIPDSPVGGKAAARQYLENFRDVDAVFCASSNIAQSFMNSLVRNNVQIPEKCKILTVSNGNKEQDECTVFPLSVIDIQRHQLAGKCLEQIMKRRKNPNAEYTAETVKPVYIERESC